MRPLRAPAARLALALSLAACARELELPPLRTAPVLTSLSPGRAWAGQLVRVEGTGLDADPAANVVAFAGATTRGLRFEGPALVLRVPDDAGSGPVIVTNGRGTSDPFGALEYLGLGEPRRRAVSTGRPILHGPAAVHAVGGDTFVHSALYGGLLKAGDPGFSSPPAALTAAAPWKGALYVTEQAGRDVRLWRLDAASGALAGPRVLPFAPTQLLAMRGVDLVVGFDGAGGEVAAWDLDTLTTVVPPTPLDGSLFHAADVGDGRAVVLWFDYGIFDVTLALLDFSAALGGSLPPPKVMETPFTPALPALVAVAVANAAAAPGILPGEPLAAVTLEGGDLGVARLGAHDPVFVATPAPVLIGAVETFSPSPVEALAGAATLPVVLATKPGDGLSVGVDLLARAAVWSVPGQAPTVASAAGDFALVAHRGDNDVSIVNLASGSRVARVNLDLAPAVPGIRSYGRAVALLPRDPATPDSEDELFFPATAFPGLVRYPLGAGAPSLASRGGAVALVAASGSPAVVWAASAGGEIAAFAGRSHASPVSPASLAGAPVLAATEGPLLAVGHDGGFAVLDAATFVGSTALPGATALDGLGFDGGGLAFTVAARADGELVQLWDPALLTAPLAEALLPPQTVRAALLLEDGLWLLGRALAGDAASLLGPDLAPVRSVALAAPIPAVHAVSPNRRLLVYREPVGGAGETVLAFYRADPEAGFPQIDRIVVEGNVEGLAFDATGERLWVVTRGPDRIVLVD